MFQIISLSLSFSHSWHKSWTGWCFWWEGLPLWCDCGRYLCPTKGSDQGCQVSLTSQRALFSPSESLKNSHCKLQGWKHSFWPSCLIYWGIRVRSSLLSLSCWDRPLMLLQVTSLPSLWTIRVSQEGWDLSHSSFPGCRIEMFTVSSAYTPAHLTERKLTGAWICKTLQKQITEICSPLCQYLLFHLHSKEHHALNRFRFQCACGNTCVFTANVICST